MTQRVNLGAEDWPCIRKLGDATPDGRIEVGPTEDRLAPLEIINMVSQVRQEYDEGSLDDLTEAMIVQDEDGSKRIQLIQPITVGYFHRNDLKGYLGKLNDTWGTEHTLDELTSIPGSHGRYYLLVIAGHRRTITIPRAAKRAGIDPDRIDVVFHMVEGTEFTFRDGIKTQYRENFHQRPESWEDAIAINAIFGEGRSSGEYRTFADCAMDLGIRPERVAAAYRFNELPQVVQDLVEEKTLQYSAVGHIYNLALAMAFRDGRDRYTTEGLQQFFAQYDQGRAMLSDALAFLNDKELERWERELVYTHIKSEDIRKGTVGKIAKYVEDVSPKMMEGRGQTQLVLAPQKSESSIKREQDNKEAATLRRIMRGALIDIIGVLVAENSRVQNGRRPVMGEDLSPKLLTNVHTALRGVETLSDQLYGISQPELDARFRASIESGRLALSEIEAQISSEVDPLTEAARDLPDSSQGLFG